ncbi:MAG: hypothetical protein PVF54_09475 [Anaerolineae bacterium]|jgi:hypothetical protein
MKILLRWMVHNAWILYVGCAVGALIYLVRALGAQRERNLALFTLEHETATARAARAWAMVFVFLAIALVVFAGVRFLLASFPTYDPESRLPTPTPSSGVKPPTPSATPTPTESVAMPTFGSGTATESPPTLAPSPTRLPNVAPTSSATAPPAARGAASGAMQVRFGKVGVLVGYELSSTETRVGRPLVLTLLWQGQQATSPADYVVFTHLLSQDGELLAQHDGPPASGSQPTSDWEAGEIIRDTHEMTFKSGVGSYEGPAAIAVGLYDSGDMSARVTTSEGQDRATLPVTIIVVAP